MVNDPLVAAPPSFVVVDVHGRIRYVSANEDEGSELKWIIASRVKLQPDVETFVRGLPTAGDDASSVRMGTLGENRILRAVRVVGSDGIMFILSVEEDRNWDSLTRAARRHQLTRRETEVLSLILDGSSAGEIAEMLALSEHTVQGYFKRLLYKTGARNRVSMVAGIFDWDPQMNGVRPVAPAVQQGDRSPLRKELIRATM